LLLSRPPADVLKIDELHDIRFLEIQCGSVLRVVLSQTEKSAVVSAPQPIEALQVIHETFRSFLMDSHKCGMEFFIDEEAAHTHIAFECHIWKY
jgi:hypothetical protein